MTFSRKLKSLLQRWQQLSHLTRPIHKKCELTKFSSNRTTVQSEYSIFDNVAEIPETARAAARDGIRSFSVDLQNFDLKNEFSIWFYCKQQSRTTVVVSCINKPTNNINFRQYRHRVAHARKIVGINYRSKYTESML